MTIWTFPLIEAGTEIDLGKPLGLLAPGVRGYAIEKNGFAYIPMILADSEGRGDVGRFLDSLPLAVKVANVTSPRLRGMLERRGFQMAIEEECDVWVKLSPQEPK